VVVERRGVAAVPAGPPRARGRHRGARSVVRDRAPIVARAHIGARTRPTRAGARARTRARAPARRTWQSCRAESCHWSSRAVRETARRPGAAPALLPPAAGGRTVAAICRSGRPRTGSPFPPERGSEEPHARTAHAGWVGARPRRGAVSARRHPAAPARPARRPRHGRRGRHVARAAGRRCSGPSATPSADAASSIRRSTRRGASAART
jgi:hypothetical protein